MHKPDRNLLATAPVDSDIARILRDPIAIPPIDRINAPIIGTKDRRTHQNNRNLESRDFPDVLDISLRKLVYARPVPGATQLLTGQRIIKPARRKTPLN
jgi:hypothetical protein